MKLPRDIRGDELAQLLNKFGYSITRQTGSHLRLTRILKEEHHITIPKHKNLKIGTLNNIIKILQTTSEKQRKKFSTNFGEKADYIFLNLHKDNSKLRRNLGSPASS